MKQIGMVVVLIVSLVVAAGARGEDPVIPLNCRISGEAEIIAYDFSSREFVLGDLSGSADSAVGSLAHITATDTFVLVPDNVTCRINGIQIGDSTGTILDTTLRYILLVEERPPVMRWFMTDIMASRNAGRGGVEWEDGLLEDRIFLTVPDELPVIGGSAGNQWATLLFTHAEDGTETSCRYRGTGATPLDLSDRYVLNTCVGSGGDIVAGEEIEVERVELHLNGSYPFGLTVVSLPARVGAIVSDFYLLAVEDESRAEVFRFTGWVDADTGDLVVESLD